MFAYKYGINLAFFVHVYRTFSHGQFNLFANLPSFTNEMLALFYTGWEYLKYTYPLLNSKNKPA